MSSIELFWRPGTCARVPYVALEESGAPFEVHVLIAWRGDMDSPEFRAVNPKGKVPALRIDGVVVTENPVVLSVLAERFPAADLLPPRWETGWYEAQELMAWFASELHRAVTAQRFPRSFTINEGSEHLEGIRLKARAQLVAGFEILERRLRRREWLLGDWSMLDVYMLYLWWRAIGSGMEADRFPRCADHGRRVEQRPSVARVLDREEAEFAKAEEEGLVPPGWPPHYVGRIPTHLVPWLSDSFD